jgi:transcriptional regulator with GAF, ATPase, and Fis domain
MRVIDTWQTAPPSDDSEQGGLELTQSAHLRILAGACAQPAYPVEMQGLSIGREDCDVVIADDPRISRKHARVERSFAGWQFQDLGSRNGFYVNGRGYGRGQRTPLPDGSVIRIGDSVMVFRTTAPPADLRSDSPVFPGVSPEAANVRRRIDELAASLGHVLILGETGTGKESVAKAIGAQRAPHPFVTLNCAQLNREMARSELFGHVRGAFTNAVSTRPGLVDLAGEGALFLDEIGDLPLDVQAELLRFLEDGSYRALGSTDLRRSSARVVAATNIDLDKEVLKGGFRRDLLARLRANNTPLSLPPLRERREDILGWTQLFFRLRGRDPGSRPWTAGALECLLLYPWQENLRELLAAVNFAGGQTPEFPCTRTHLLPQVRAHRSALRMPADSRPDDPTPAPRMPPPPPPPPEEDLPPRPDPTRDEIIEVLKQTRGRMRTTAQLLKIDRRRLYRLCKSYDINPDHYRDRDRHDPEND